MNSVFYISIVPEHAPAVDEQELSSLLGSLKANEGSLAHSALANLCE